MTLTKQKSLMSFECRIKVRHWPGAYKRMQSKSRRSMISITYNKHPRLSRLKIRELASFIASLYKY